MFLNPLGALGVCLVALSAKGETPLASADATYHLSPLRAARIEALRAGDAAALAAPCAPDARLITEGVPTIIGTANIEAYYRAFFARFAVRDYRREGIQTWDLGPRLAEFGHFSQRLGPRSGGADFSLQGKYVEVWDRIPGGDLRLAVIAWNFDRWLPNAEVLRIDSVPSVRTATLARVPVANDLTLELAADALLIQRAVMEHDAALWSRFYAADAVLLPNNDPMAEGHEAIAGFIAAHCQSLPIFEQLDLRNDRVDELGAYVYEFASHTASWRNGATSGVSTGKNLRIWQHEPGRPLRLILHISAYD